MFILLATAVSAAVEIKEDRIFLDVDYNHLETENQKQIDFTGSLTLSNSGTEVLLPMLFLVVFLLAIRRMRLIRSR